MHGKTGFTPPEGVLSIGYQLTVEWQARSASVRVDPEVLIAQVLEGLMDVLRLPRTDARAVPLLYVLSYKGRILNNGQTLVKAGVPSGATLEVIGLPTDLG